MDSLYIMATKEVSIGYPSFFIIIGCFFGCLKSKNNLLRTKDQPATARFY